MDLGDTITLSVDLRDNTGALANATSITLRVDRPDGVTDTPSVLNPPTVTGKYLYPYTPTLVGRYRVHWTSTGPTTAFSDVFDVRDSADQMIFSLAEAKSHLNMTSTYTKDDDEIRSMIEAVTVTIESHRNEIVAPRTVTEYDSIGTFDRIVLGYKPVISITSIQDLRNTNYNVADWVLDPVLGTLTRPFPGFGYPWVGLKVVYKAGYTQIPANYILAAKIILKHLWETQRVQNIGQQVTLGNRSAREEQIMTPAGQGFAIPYRAVELLGPPASFVV